MAAALRVGIVNQIIYCLYIFYVAGVVTSPRFPGGYPHQLEKTETIEVENGKILRLEFLSFAVFICGDLATCQCDFVKITDGNGKVLMDNSCGYSSPFAPILWHFAPPIIETSSNRVDIFFHTDDFGTATGWSLEWRAVNAPGRTAFNNIAKKSILGHSYI